jgi:hypothetical protein
VPNGTVSRLAEHRTAHLAAISGARGRRYLKRQQLLETRAAVRLGLDAPAVCRLIDPDHHSPLANVERALRAVGRSLVVGDRAHA